MSTTPTAGFTYELLTRHDSTFGKINDIKFHGRLTGKDAQKVKELVKPLLEAGGRTVLDLADLEFMDSTGLGALVGLKVTALNRGLCRLELENLSPRIKDLFTLANLQSLFDKQPA
jgi:anti-sigma B factor antagonist